MARTLDIPPEWRDNFLSCEVTGTVAQAVDQLDQCLKGGYAVTVWRNRHTEVTYVGIFLEDPSEETLVKTLADGLVLKNPASYGEEGWQKKLLERSQ